MPISPMPLVGRDGLTAVDALDAGDDVGPDADALGLLDVLEAGEMAGLRHGLEAVVAAPARPVGGLVGPLEDALEVDAPGLERHRR